MRIIEDLKNNSVRLVWFLLQKLLLLLNKVFFQGLERDTIERIIIFRTGQLGDTILALPAINYIRSLFPNGHISLLTDRHGNANYVSAQTVVSLTNGVDDFLFFDSAQMNNRAYRKNLITTVRDRSYDILFYLGAERESTVRVIRNMVWWRFMAGLKSANGFTKGHILGKLEERFLDLYSLSNEADRLLESVLHGSLKIPNNIHAKFGIASAKTESVQRILKQIGGCDICAIAPGSKMQVKQWGVEKYRELGNRLLKQHPNFFLVVLGGKEDEAIGQELVRSWGSQVVNLAGRLSIQESYTILEHADLFVGNDSGTMHLAAAAGLACVGIFTARSPKNLWYPYGTNHKVIRHETDCHYCLLEDCTIQKAKCIRSIDVDEVFRAAEEILQKTKAGKPASPKFRFVDTRPELAFS